MSGVGVGPITISLREALYIKLLGRYRFVLPLD